MMRKIVIVGSPGAGKSTLARKLGELLDIPVIHLDHYFWKENWRKPASSKRQEFIRKKVDEQAWIIEGTYHDRLGTLLKEADTIVFLDMPVSLCLWRVIKRSITERERPDLPKNTKDVLRPRLIKRVLQFSGSEYIYLMCRLNLKTNRHKVVRFTSSEELAISLEKLRSGETDRLIAPQQQIATRQIKQSVLSVLCLITGLILSPGSLF